MGPHQPAYPQERTEGSLAPPAIRGASCLGPHPLNSSRAVPRCLVSPPNQALKLESVMCAYVSVCVCMCVYV